MHKNVKAVGSALYYIYFISFVLAAPYFNWRYAKENGFVSWLVFGEVVATAEALIWPYYAIAGFGPAAGTPDARTDIHFANSRQASHKALKIIERFGGIMALPPTEVSDVVQLLEASVTEAELVEDTYLQQVHPEFLGRFRREYTASLRNLADGFRAGDEVKLISSVAAYNSFSEWVRLHANELKFP